MTLEDRLSEAFDRGLRDGIETLNPSDRKLFRIQDFIIEYEMGGLSSYFYNRLSDIQTIRAAIAAMKQNGLTELASLLHEATILFADYSDPNSFTTWSEVCKKYDPSGNLDRIAERIGKLPNYGMK